MKAKRLRAVYGVLAVLALVSLTQNLANATPGTATFDLTGVNGLNLAGVYTSPYIGGTAVTNPAGPNPTGAGPVICDDFSDNSYIPEEWTTYVTSMSNGVFGATDTSVLKWTGADSGGTVDGSSGWNLDQQTAYDVAAYLVLQIEGTHDATTQEDLSFALWELFAPTSAANSVLPANAKWGGNTDNVVGWLSSHNASGGAGSDLTDLTTATADLEAAITTVTTLGFNGLSNVDVTIYSYNQDPTATKCGTGLSGACSTLPPQEFISVTTGSNQIRVPEASFFDSFSLYFLAGGAGLVFLSRRKIFRTQA